MSAGSPAWKSASACASAALSPGSAAASWAASARCRLRSSTSSWNSLSSAPSSARLSSLAMPTAAAICAGLNGRPWPIVCRPSTISTGFVFFTHRGSGGPAGSAAFSSATFSSPSSSPFSSPSSSPPSAAGGCGSSTASWTPSSWRKLSKPMGTAQYAPSLGTPPRKSTRLSRTTFSTCTYSGYRGGTSFGSPSSSSSASPSGLGGAGRGTHRSKVGGAPPPLPSSPSSSSPSSPPPPPPTTCFPAMAAAPDEVQVQVTVGLPAALFDFRPT
mmetsp:Transcript_31306/g.54043  ORF Transcript_31306/g.54043 Transcript_31306/m.54043 type:complete len:272 (-) Transcript_31306:411-1226(-)